MAAPKKISILLAFAGIYLIWGSTYLGILFAIQSIPPLLMAGARFLFAGTLRLIVGIAAGEARQFDLQRITTQSFVAFIYLVLIGGIIGYVSYAWLLRHCEPSKVATYAYVNPIVAVILGALFAHET